MKGFRRTAVVAVVVAGFVAAPVLAYGDGSIALDLVATPTLKAQLRSAFLAAHPGVAPSEVGSPFPGRTYYGSYSDVPYAVATFSITGARAYPTVFKMDRRGRWHVRTDARRRLYGRRAAGADQGLVVAALERPVLRPPALDQGRHRLGA
jgi:hypothetical protein